MSGTHKTRHRDATNGQHPPAPVQVHCSLAGLIAAGGLFASPAVALAGGSGLNTVVVVNQASSNSRELGNYYREQRQVPADNVLRVEWTGGNISWTSQEFQTNLLQPLLGMLAARQLTNQVDYVVLSMDIPFRTIQGSSTNSTTAALFYGLKPDGGFSWKGATNSYAGSEAVFRQSRPASAPGYSFLAAMLTSDSLAGAKKIIDSGVGGDDTPAPGCVILQKTSDPLRNVRYPTFDNTLFDARLSGAVSVTLTNSDAIPGQTNLIGFQTGLATFGLPANAFRPGAMADSMTSFGGVIFGPNSQTNLLEFLRAGAAGSYGTVAEPSSDTNKFPESRLFFYQARGFSLAECYYQSVQVPYLGLLVGEPLSAPFRRSGWGRWAGTNTTNFLAGVVPLSVSFAAADSTRPLQQLELFVDGKFFMTVTNCGATAGNELNVSLNGYPVSYTVPGNATLSVMATGLAAAINNPVVSNATKVVATVRGDRIELRSTSTNGLAETYFFADPEAQTLSNRFYRVRYVPDSYPPELTALGRDVDGRFRLQMAVGTDHPTMVQASTNLADWASVYTNTSHGLVTWTDPDSDLLPQRFYRMLVPARSALGAPFLYPLSLTASGFQLHLEGPPGQAYVLQSSTDLANWSPLLTNSTGGALDYVDAAAATRPAGYYRTWTAAQDPLPTLSVVAGPAGQLLRIDHPVRPYFVEGSSNGADWVGLMTNFVTGRIVTSAGSEAGTAGLLTSFIHASQGEFLDSTALGMTPLTVEGTATTGSWLWLTVTRTNNMTAHVGITNLAAPTTATELSRQLVTAINSNTLLMNPDGISADDLTTDVFGVAHVNLRARTPGLKASLIRISFTGSAGLLLTPAASTCVNSNLTDLQPRNHLYVSAGVARLAPGFSLDTTAIPDGVHQFTAVAYEGTHVAAQTHASVSVTVSNSPLSATLTSPDLSDPAPVQGLYHFDVVGNTNTVRIIRLLGTGGTLGAVTNQAAASFAVSGAFLGPGMHSFWAEVETTNGLRFRSAPLSARLVANP